MHSSLGLETGGEVSQSMPSMRLGSLKTVGTFSCDRYEKRYDKCKMYIMANQGWS